MFVLCHISKMSKALDFVVNHKCITKIVDSTIVPEDTLMLINDKGTIFDIVV